MSGFGGQDVHVAVQKRRLPSEIGNALNARQPAGAGRPLRGEGAPDLFYQRHVVYGHAAEIPGVEGVDVFEALEERMIPGAGDEGLFPFHADARRRLVFDFLEVGDFHGLGHESSEVVPELFFGRMGDPIGQDEVVDDGEQHLARGFVERMQELVATQGDLREDELLSGFALGHRLAEQVDDPLVDFCGHALVLLDHPVGGGQALQRVGDRRLHSQVDQCRDFFLHEALFRHVEPAVRVAKCRQQVHDRQHLALGDLRIRAEHVVRFHGSSSNSPCRSG